MTIDQTFTVVAYDIPDDRRRKRVSDILKDFGERVQYSVFECELTPSQRSDLESRILAEIEKTEDGVRFYIICANCKPKIVILGVGQLWSEDDVLII